MFTNIATIAIKQLQDIITSSKFQGYPYVKEQVGIGTMTYSEREKRMV